MTLSFRKPDAKEEKAKALCLEQMTQDRQELLIRWPFIGGIIMRMDLVPVRDDRLPTACTDGSTIFADCGFYSALPRTGRLFVLAHEVWHSVMLHFARKQNRDRELFNIAADLEIYFALKKEKLRAPVVLPHDPAWEGLSAEEIYEKLKTKHAGSEESDSADPADGGACCMDGHIYKGDRVPDADDLAGQENSSEDGKKKKSEGGGAEEQTMVLDDDYSPVLAQDAAEKIRARVIASAQQIERTQGTLPAGIAALVERMVRPQLPWQELLKQFVSSCYGGRRRWLPPARRHVWQGLYLPSLYDHSISAVVAIDTSGSTAGDQQSFFSELISLMRSFGKFELTVLQCDAKVQQVESFSDVRPLSPREQWRIRGMGGTSFTPVFDYVAEHKMKPDLLIYFTDGEGTAPPKAPPYPVMWILTRKGRKPAVWGRSAQFKRD